MRIGIDIAQQRVPFGEVIARATLADEAGFDGVWGFDHFQPMYGEGPGECFEGMTTLAALSGHTTRVRLGLLVAGVTYRHPSVFAAEAMTIDHASNGRLELSLGAAWFQKEHEELGILFPGTAERIERLDEALTIIRGLLTTSGFSFEGRHFTVADATLDPKPVQSPHPPIWIGASGERKMLPLVAKHADAWHCYGSPSDMAAKSQKLTALAEAAGRDPESILRASSLDLSRDDDSIRRAVDRFRDAGVGYLVAGWPSEGRDRVAHVVEHLLPELTAA